MPEDLAGDKGGQVPVVLVEDDKADRERAEESQVLHRWLKIRNSSFGTRWNSMRMEMVDLVAMSF